MKKLLAIVLVVAVLAVGSGIALAGNNNNGNGAPSGTHYTLNIIGVPQGHEKTAEMKYTQGHTIFVPLKGRAKIYLLNSQDPANDEYCSRDLTVWDRNGTDSDGATFCLPPPEVVAEPSRDCPEGTTEYNYSVWARALGTPGGKSFTTTCATEIATGDVVCSSITMVLERNTGKSKFTDVSKYLLFIYIEGVRYPLFDEAFEDFFWKYDNDGLKLAQLRFYPVATCVPDTADYVTADPDCIAANGTTQVVFAGVGTHFDTNLSISIFDDNGKRNVTCTEVGTTTAESLTLNLTTTAATVSPITIYITSGSGQDKETVNTSLQVGGCP